MINPQKKFGILAVVTAVLLVAVACDNGMNIGSDPAGALTEPTPDVATSECSMIGTPLLSGPAEAEMLSDANPTFSWQPATCAATYLLEVAADSEFTKPVISTSPITDTNYKLPSHLSLYSGEYFWRVRAEGQDGAVSEYSEIRKFGVNLFNTSILKTIPNNGEAGVSVNKEIVVFLSERLSDGQDVAALIEVSQKTMNGDIVEGAVSYDSNSRSVIFTPKGNLAGVENFFVIFKGNIPDATGKNIASYAFNFQTGAEPDLTPPQVVETNPKNATKGFPINADLSAVFNEEISVTTATGENFYISDIEGNKVEATVIPDVGSKQVVIKPAVNLKYETIYLFHIGTNVADIAGNHLLEESVVAFESAKFPDYEPPAVPELLSPVSNAKIGDPNPLFIWKGSDDSVKFRIQIASDDKFQNIIYDFDAITEQKFTMPPHLSLTDGKYYWRLKAVDKCDNWSEFTVENIFIVKLFSADILKTIPVNGEGNVALNQAVMVLLAKPLDEGLDMDQLVTVFKDYQGGEEVIGKVVYDALSKTIIFTPEAQFLQEQKYYVELSSDWIDPYAFVFQTGKLPDGSAPEVTATNPLNEAKGFPINGAPTANFSKDLMPGTVTNDNFAIFDVNGAAVDCNVSYDVYSRTVKLVPKADLAYESTYSLKIVTGVKDTSGNSLAKEHIVTFQSAKFPDFTPPTPPVLQSPVNGDVTSDANPMFAWASSADSVKFHIQISKTDLFSSVVLEVNSLVQPIFTMPVHLSLYEGTYYWRVRASDVSENWSNWSDSFVLHVSPTTPNTPAASSNIIYSNTTPDIQWSSVGGITSYAIQVSPDMAFSNILWTKDGLGSPSVEVPDGKLSPGIYYWRVRSEIWSGSENTFNSKWSTARQLNIKQAEINAAQSRTLKDEDNNLSLTISPYTLNDKATVEVEKYATATEVAPFDVFANPKNDIATPVFKISSNSPFKKEVSVNIKISEDDMANRYNEYGANLEGLYYKSTQGGSWAKVAGTSAYVTNGTATFSGKIPDAGYVVGAANIEKHCWNEFQDTKVGETGIDCGGNCPASCTDCNGFDFGNGEEAHWYSFGNTAVNNAANEALQEYATKYGKNVASLDVYEKMKAVALYVTGHMRWMRDEGDWEGSQSAYTTLVETGNRTGWFVGKEEANDPDYKGVKYGNCIKDGGMRSGSDPRFCGDCEDHAILRASLMRHLGIAQNCVMIAEYHDYLCHPTKDGDCTPWSEDNTPSEPEDQGINDYFDDRLTLIGGPESDSEESDNVYKKGSHAFNIILYKNKFRILDFWSYNQYFHTPSDETQFSWWHHRTDNVANDHFGHFWDEPFTPPPSVIANYKGGPVCYEAGLNYWTHFTLYDGSYSGSEFVGICP